MIKTELRLDKLLLGLNQRITKINTEERQWTKELKSGLKKEVPRNR
jgi:hypothetical protein